LQNNNEWVQCFEEVIVFATGGALRTLFATAVIHSRVVDPNQLWTQFKLHICNDLPRRIQRLTIPIPNDIPMPYLDYGLYLLSKLFADASKTLAEYGLPVPIAR